MSETIEQALALPDVRDAFTAAQQAAQRCRAAPSDEEASLAANEALEHVERAIRLIRKQVPEAYSLLGERSLRGQLVSRLLPQASSSD